MNFEQRINSIEAYKTILEQNIEKKKDILKEHQQEQKNAIEAKIILQIAAKNTQSNLEFHFSNIVTKALHVVFDDPYKFVPEFIERRNKTECDLWLIRDDQKLRPKFAVGGGVRDIIAFALRLSYWKIEKSSPIIILDEPFKNLSRNLIPKAINILRFLSNKFNLQMIIVTHIAEIAEQADSLFEVEQGQIQQIEQGSL